MPELSIAAYIDNITYFGIILFLAMFVLLIIFLFSKLFRRQARTGTESQIETSRTRPLMELKKDPNLVRNLLSLSFIFLSLNIFVLFILLVFPFSNNVILGANFYLIIGFLFFIVAIAVFIVKSKILK